jgi:hypothetical protein
MKFGATDVIVTKNKGFEERHVGRLDLIIVCELQILMICIELMARSVHCRRFGGYSAQGSDEDHFGAWEVPGVHWQPGSTV